MPRAATRTPSPFKTSKDYAKFFSDGGIFNVRTLFSQGEQGVWYDPSDFTSMYQDSAGTTPVTAVGQPVGLLLDKRFGLVRGAQLAPSNYSAGIAEAAAAGVTVSATEVDFSAVAQLGGVGLTGGVSFANGGAYEVTFTISNFSAGGFRVLVYGTGFVATTDTKTANGAYTFRIPSVAGGSRNQMIFLQATNAAPNTFKVSGISVKHIPGNHATQATAASRPVVSAKYNLLTKTEQFDDPAWLKQTGGTGAVPVVTPNAATAPNGTLTADKVDFVIGAGTTSADLSILQQTAASAYTGGGSIYLRADAPVRIQARTGSTWTMLDVTTAWQRFVLPSTASGSLQIGLRPGYAEVVGIPTSASVYIWGADLRSDADAALNIPAYQQVNTATDYDTAGFPYYLSFDGVDDSLATASINFSATDKMTVWAGVNKQSDAVFGVVCEFSPDINSNNGAFAVLAPGSNATANLRMQSKGTLSATAFTDSTFDAPISLVFAGIADISGDLTIARGNGLAGLTVTADQGLGSYGNYPLYLGRRNGSSSPFNGRLYSLIVRGVASTAELIAATERYVGGKTGIILP